MNNQGFTVIFDLWILDWLFPDSQMFSPIHDGEEPWARGKHRQLCRLGRTQPIGGLFVVKVRGGRLQ